MNWHTVGTFPARSRDAFPGIVAADEGGGTTPHPYRGGVRLGDTAEGDVAT